MPHTMCQWVAFLAVVFAGLLVHWVIVTKTIMGWWLDPGKLYRGGPRMPDEEEGGEQQFRGVKYGNWVGAIEIVIYSVSFAFRHPEFIAVWLATKYIASMNKWSVTALGRSFYNRSLIGSGVTLILGFMTGGLARLVSSSLEKHDWHPGFPGTHF
jgi:hypothetical protein